MSSRMRQGISTADIAIEVLREFDCSLVWYGHPNLLHEIADRAGFRRGHPLNRTAAVVRVVGQSDRFEFAGVIRHLGREYRCYREKGSSAPRE
ncbi:MAG: hypothetical protein RJQ08_11740 [Salinisphaeraceae bacterium]